MKAFHPYGNLLFLVVGVLVAIWIARTPWFADMVASISAFGIFGIFIAGMLYAFAFTAPASIVILAALGLIFHSVVVSIVGGLGAMAADAFLLVIVRYKLAEQVRRAVKNLRIRKNGAPAPMLVRWTVILAGLFIIASPLPDEIGVGLLGFSKIRLRFFIPLSFVLNSIGIYVLSRAVGVW